MLAEGHAFVYSAVNMKWVKQDGALGLNACNRRQSSSEVKTPHPVPVCVSVDLMTGLVTK